MVLETTTKTGKRSLPAEQATRTMLEGLGILKTLPQEFNILLAQKDYEVSSAEETSPEPSRDRTEEKEPTSMQRLPTLHEYMKRRGYGIFLDRLGADRTAVLQHLDEILSEIKESDMETTQRDFLLNFGDNFRLALLEHDDTDLDALADSCFRNAFKTHLTPRAKKPHSLDGEEPEKKPAKPPTPPEMTVVERLQKNFEEAVKAEAEEGKPLPRIFRKAKEKRKAADRFPVITLATGKDTECQYPSEGLLDEALETVRRQLWFPEHMPEERVATCQAWVTFLSPDTSTDLLHTVVMFTGNMISSGELSVEVKQLVMNATRQLLSSLHPELAQALLSELATILSPEDLRYIGDKLLRDTGIRTKTMPQKPRAPRSPQAPAKAISDEEKATEKTLEPEHTQPEKPPEDLIEDILTSQSSSPFLKEPSSPESPSAQHGETYRDAKSILTEKRLLPEPSQGPAQDVMPDKTVFETAQITRRTSLPGRKKIISEQPAEPHSARSKTPDKQVDEKKHDKPKVEKKPGKTIHEKKPDKPVAEKKHDKPLDEMKHDKPLDEKKHDKPLDEKKHDKPLDEKKHDKPLDEKKHGKPLDEKKHDKPLDEKKHGKPLDEKKHGRPLDEQKHVKVMEEKKPDKPVGRKKPSRQLRERLDKKIFFKSTSRFATLIKTVKAEPKTPVLSPQATIRQDQEEEEDARQTQDRSTEPGANQQKKLVLCIPRTEEDQEKKYSTQPITQRKDFRAGIQKIKSVGKEDIVQGIGIHIVDRRTIHYQQPSDKIPTPDEGKASSAETSDTKDTPKKDSRTPLPVSPQDQRQYASESAEEIAKEEVKDVDKIGQELDLHKDTGIKAIPTNIVEKTGCTTLLSNIGISLINTVLSQSVDSSALTSVIEQKRTKPSAVTRQRPSAKKEELYTHTILQLVPTESKAKEGTSMVGPHIEGKTVVEEREAGDFSKSTLPGTADMQDTTDALKSGVYLPVVTQSSTEEEDQEQQQTFADGLKFPQTTQKITASEPSPEKFSSSSSFFITTPTASTGLVPPCTPTDFFPPTDSTDQLRQSQLRREVKEALDKLMLTPPAPKSPESHKHAKYKRLIYLSEKYDPDRSQTKEKARGASGWCRDEKLASVTREDDRKTADYRGQQRKRKETLESHQQANVWSSQFPGSVLDDTEHPPVKDQRPLLTDDDKRKLQILCSDDAEAADYMVKTDPSLLPLLKMYQLYCGCHWTAGEAGLRVARGVTVRSRALPARQKPSCPIRALEGRLGMVTADREFGESSYGKMSLQWTTKVPRIPVDDLKERVRTLEQREYHHRKAVSRVPPALMRTPLPTVFMASTGDPYDEDVLLASARCSSEQVASRVADEKRGIRLPRLVPAHPKRLQEEMLLLAPLLQQSSFAFLPSPIKQAVLNRLRCTKQ